MEETTKQTVEAPKSLWDRVSDFRHDRRLKSKREAVILLLEAGLDAMQKQPVRAGNAKGALK